MPEDLQGIQRRPYPGMEAGDPGLLWMIAISFCVHALVISLAIALPGWFRTKSDFPLDTMVRLVSPSDIGLNEVTSSPSVPDTTRKRTIIDPFRSERMIPSPMSRSSIDPRGPLVLPKEERILPSPQKDTKAEWERVKQKIDTMKRKGEEERQAVPEKRADREEAGSRPPSKGSAGPSQWRVQASLLAEYALVVKERVRKNWSFPRTSESLSAILSLQIDREGRIEAIHFERKSGDPRFDDSILRALKKTLLPPPPEGIRGEVFVITFHSGEAGPG